MYNVIMHELLKASALSHVHVQNHGITELSHFHACRPVTLLDISCRMLGHLATM